MNIEAYLQRIAYEGSRTPSASTFREIHRAHLFSVPFENLDIHVPRSIILSERAIFKKLVSDRRGGFCFEQNYLLAAALSQIGFETALLEANVYSRKKDSFGIPCNHLAVLVTIDGRRHLADVGFGSSFLEPLSFDTTTLQRDEAGEFRLEHDDDGGRLYGRQLGASDITLFYRFFLNPRRLEDFAAACLYMQTSPATHFTQTRVCSQWTKEGRVTLCDDRLIETNWTGARSETCFSSESDFHQLLKSRFGIALKTQAPGAESASPTPGFDSSEPGA